MAAAAHFSARVYGTVEGAPPFYDAAANGAGFSRVNDWPVSGIVSFPTTGTTFYPLANGVRVGGFYVYSVIEVAASGLNIHGDKFVTDTPVATLATNAG